LGKKVGITINNIQDYRNYKVTCEKARTYLGFLPKHSISDMVKSLYDHLDAYGDFSNDLFYNINTFKKLERPVDG
jgi:nucleoside-diphosphate-sugar epimerase